MQNSCEMAILSIACAAFGSVSNPSGKMLGEAAQLGQPMMQMDCIGFGIVPTLLSEE